MLETLFRSYRAVPAQGVVMADQIPDLRSCLAKVFDGELDLQVDRGSGLDFVPEPAALGFVLLSSPRVFLQPHRPRYSQPRLCRHLGRQCSVTMDWHSG